MGGILKRAFCLECGLEILKNKVLKIFSEILVIFWLVYQEACVNRPVRRNTGWCGAICGVIA